MKNSFSKIILAAGLAVCLAGCKPSIPEKTEEEIMEEMENEPEIIIPDEPVESAEPVTEADPVEIEEGEEGSF